MSQSLINGQSDAQKTRVSALAQTPTVAGNSIDKCPELLDEVGRCIDVPVLQSNVQSSSRNVLPTYSRSRSGKIIFFDRNSPLSYELKPGMVVNVQIVRDFTNYSIARPCRILQGCEEPGSESPEQTSQSEPFEVFAEILGQKTDLITANRVFNLMSSFFRKFPADPDGSNLNTERNLKSENIVEDSFPSTGELRRAGMLGTERAGQW